MVSVELVAQGPESHAVPGHSKQTRVGVVIQQVTSDVVDGGRGDWHGSVIHDQLIMQGRAGAALSLHRDAAHSGHPLVLESLDLPIQFLRK